MIRLQEMRTLCEIFMHDPFIADFNSYKSAKFLKIHLEMECVDLLTTAHTSPTQHPSHCAVIILFQNVPVHQLT